MAAEAATVEAEAAAKERDELAAKLKTIEDAQLSEHDKLAKRVEEYETREAEWAAEKKETALKLGVFSLQAPLGIADTDLALAALDRSQVEYDGNGQPTNLQDVLTALLEAKPLLKGVTASSASADLNAGAGAQSGPPLKLSLQAPLPNSLAATSATARLRLGMCRRRLARCPPGTSTHCPASTSGF